MSLNNNLWWCKNCGVPLLKQKCENCGSIGKKICSDLKPMFKEECEFLEKETNKGGAVEVKGREATWAKRYVSDIGKLPNG